MSLLYKAFLRPLFTCASPGWLPFLSDANITKLERLHRAASCAISGCLSSSSIPIVLSGASLLPLRVTPIHFTLLFYERALRLPTSFSISDLARLGVKPRLYRSSWRAFTSTHSLMLPSTSPREALLACLPSHARNLLPSLWSSASLFHALALISLSPAKVRLLLSLTLSHPHNLLLWTDVSVPFSFGKGGFGILAICSFCRTEASPFFLAGSVC